MEARLELKKVEPAAYLAMNSLENYVNKSGLDKTLIKLIKIRASQLNKCAFCIDMHTKEARSNGETEQRIYVLNAWRETPFFSPEDRAVLELTEAVTLISENQVPNSVYEEVSRYFSETEIAKLLMAIVTINAWNRIAITTKMIPGTY
ncbi:MULTISPECIES: carboxymuconolactone decarboxylase family protein [Moorena]|uniref:Alkylhydroperoxidase AhpD family, core domain protein n=2 Tax=Moorena TaxID=1155738 RepID=F4XTC8_9CYAN|nr:MULTISPECIES: carboxymuconolactone decarboxylase family protein [Moorena]EGJ32164.1 alkylhydroperoxidase AhpD family, core domain protein [Moorena producens 3L]OLT65517.1 carboxymuconolactone decarboxylase [Moorena producens 3L]